jgi:glycerol-3-phosphate O-acyltransferase
VTILPSLGSAWHWSVRKIIGLWVRVTLKPEDAAAEIAALPRPVCYVLEHDSQTDLAVLNNACIALHLPSPERRLIVGQRRAGKARRARQTIAAACR